MPHNMHTIETYTGKIVDLVYPTPDTIALHDIAWGLSRTARFNGHTLGEHPYSVAQHSVWVAKAAQNHCSADASTAWLLSLQALLHDAHEAYSGDICSPLKKTPQLQGVLSLESRLQTVIHSALHVPEPGPVADTLIKQCDHMALAVEARHLMPSNGSGWACMKGVDPKLFVDFWEPLPAVNAFDLFLDAYSALARGLSLEGVCG